MKPLLYVIGDSISLMYGPLLEKMIAPRMHYARKSGTEAAMQGLEFDKSRLGAEWQLTDNGGDSMAVRLFVQAMVTDASWRPAVVLVNAGLHDIKVHTASGALQVTLEQYRENLRAIATLLASCRIPMVWVRTTLVADEIHNTRIDASQQFARYDKDRAAYDAAAVELMSQLGVPVLDLYSFTLALGGDPFADHVHYKEAVCAQQAAYIAGYLQHALDSGRLGAVARV